MNSPTVAKPLVEAMLDPSFYPDHPETVEMIETHVSWVMLAGTRAFKLRKSVVYPFLDYGTVERRLEMSNEEVRLGRRLAGNMYLGVRSIILNADGGFTLADASAPDAIDYVVEMRRYDATRTLAALLERCEVTSYDIRQLARRLGAFYVQAEVAPAASFGPRVVAASVDENFTTMIPFASHVGEHVLASGHRFAVAFLHRNRDRFDERAKQGWVRDCHGDLRAEQVIVTGATIEIPDPVEFDPALRLTDVAADIAFLVMDLYDAGAEKLADVLLDECASQGIDYGGQQLLFFYATYRAWVRAKVACMRAGGASLAAERDRQLLEACRFALLGSRLAWQARGSLMLVVCGRSAAGKSLLSTELSHRSGFPVLNSDVIRKELAGLAPSDRGSASDYSEDASIRTYRELGVRAAECVRDHGVIVDATFRRRADRQAFADGLGEAVSTPLFVVCSAPDSVVMQRARERELDPSRISDADLDVVARQAHESDPLDEIAARVQLLLRTDRPASASADYVEAWLDDLLSP
ncbi:MAG TPA: AAA family ATPase [Solirubrobacteraceae bacterium]|jgi:aminoglycoside phosphotransferase family enzyme/predicted kinase|nr:AAA family ATPase [Solirubrobacteraceae bacterium]